MHYVKLRNYGSKCFNQHAPDGNQVQIRQNLDDIVLIHIAIKMYFERVPLLSLISEIEKQVLDIYLHLDPTR